MVKPNAYKWRCDDSYELKLHLLQLITEVMEMMSQFYLTSDELIKSGDCLRRDCRERRLEFHRLVRDTVISIFKTLLANLQTNLHLTFTLVVKVTLQFLLQLATLAVVTQ